MRTLIKYISLAACVAVAGCATTAPTVVSTPKAMVAPYSREQTQDDVRVILLSVDRSTVFTDQGLSQTNHPEIHAVPGLRVVYVVEALGSEPVSFLNQTSEAYAGTNNLSKSIPENLVAGGVGGINDYESYCWGSATKKPEVQKPNRASVYEDWLRGVRVPNGKLDLHITTGFNEHKQTFIFKDIPVD